VSDRRARRAKLLDTFSSCRLHSLCSCCSCLETCMDILYASGPRGTFKVRTLDACRMRSSKQVTFYPLTRCNELLCDLWCVFLCCRRSSLEAQLEFLLPVLQATLRLDEALSGNPLCDR